MRCYQHHILHGDFLRTILAPHQVSALPRFAMFACAGLRCGHRCGTGDGCTGRPGQPLPVRAPHPALVQRLPGAAHSYWANTPTVASNAKGWQGRPQRDWSEGQVTRMLMPHSGWVGRRSSAETASSWRRRAATPRAFARIIRVHTSSPLPSPKRVPPSSRRRHQILATCWSPVARLM